MFSNLIRWLVESFDFLKCCLRVRNIELEIIEEDVYLILGFYQGNKVVVEGVKKYILKYYGLLKEWKRQWGEKDVIILNIDIFNRMKK